ncbi:MAG: hypothetical protein KGL12_08765 [Rhodospirillales bacterium]|nr:hypothetical protein [Rhodospirillales bacterium]
MCHSALNRHDLAESVLERAVAACPDQADIAYHLGNARLARGAPGAALAAYDLALSWAPDHVSAWHNRGVALAAMGAPGPAAESFRAVLARAPAHASAAFHLGRALIALDQPEAALEVLAQAARLPHGPARAVALADHRAIAWMALGDARAALAESEAARQLQPDQPLLAWNAALAHLTLGDFAAGWPLYESRMALADPAAPPPPMPALADLIGRHVLLRAEQGRGDMIQFARYAPLLAARRVRVTLAVYPDLLRLMRHLPGTAVISTEAEEPAHDRSLPLLSLPLLLATRLATIPLPIPYRPAPASVEFTPGLRHAAIAVSGAPGNAADGARSIAASAFAPILAVPGWQFHVLQTALRPADAAFLRARPTVVDHSATLADFADTAALLARMDAVIGVDTALIHLAGTLGLAVGVLLAVNADWRWLRGRDDSPWYPGMRLFRQNRRGIWAEPITAAAAWLSRLPPAPSRR